MKKCNEFNVNEIVIIEQLPEIFYQLEEVGKFIEENLKDIKTMDCTEENKQEVKKRRTEINNVLKQFETKRKDVKKRILESYNLFEDKYTQEVKTKLESASNELSNKISDIEIKQKTKKEEELIRFFNQYQQMYHLENILNYSDLNLNVTLSASEKSLKEKISSFCQKVAGEVNMIIQEDYRDEVMIEYTNNGFDYISAKTTILEKYKRLEKMMETINEKEKVETDESGIIEVVDTLVSTPKEIKSEEIIECEFKIKTTKDKIMKLKTFLKENEIEYF